MDLLKKIFGRIGIILSAIRRYTAHLLTIIVVVLVLTAIFSSSDKVKVPDGGLLVLAPTGILVDEAVSTNPLDSLPDTLFFGAPPTQQPVHELERALQHAATDDRIHGVYLDLRNFGGGGVSKLIRVADAINEFKASGKPVYAYSDYFMQGPYLLASQASEVYLNPLGVVDATGLESLRPYYKGLLDKLNINIHVFRVGDFKSAVEPYMLEGMSDEARENLSNWLGVLWDEYLDTVQRQRPLDPRVASGKEQDFMAIFEESGQNLAELAVNGGYVDGLKHRHEMTQYLIDRVGIDNDTNSFRSIRHKDYLSTLPMAEQNRNFPSLTASSQVAVIQASGVIVDGRGGANEIGGDRLASELRDARHNDKVKAVVLRIDSPGGSAFASEVIRQEVLLLREAGKPVIASMSSVAASGGYWIAAGADQIIAEPTTITGSIGVFGMLPIVDEALADIGINYDGVKTTEMPFMTITKPLTPAFKSMMQSGVDKIYAEFLALVAETRNMTIDEVHEVAQGQVWSGTQALTLGLVDELASIETAIERAAEQAGLDTYAVLWPEKEMSFRDRIIQQLFNSRGPSASEFDALVHEAMSSWSLFSEFNDPRGIYLRCTECTTR
ncbi:signal peptide peptidase SppA [Aliidiomarina halalkaliphila]|uniref:Signal peptide peptidase SppA n=1 Tax=Aliidiomarina halalkaliphila TaxID=2593535 RepID=A0A552X3P0_9GAMM|nr:signal peptide peptidase SppA [Aliidiomarina halalkaliphila]TRW49509.1 signal peptide peptidase SppA [Aliidiomarina halalkaliphila]